MKPKTIQLLASLLLLALAIEISAAAPATTGSAPAFSWPAITREQKPWAYWWWMGSAVDKTNLTKELQRYRDAGMGGVHIIPIYGAKGWESNFISYLSPRWMEMMSWAVTEAERLDLGVDMTTGTGWCFGGGPNVHEREGNANVVVKNFNVAAGAKLTEKFEREKIQALMAFGPHGKSTDLMEKIQTNGQVDWITPGDGWRVFAISQKASPQKVKRPAPGGEGPMLNLIYPAAMDAFLRGFSEAFDNYKGAKPRAQYHDSYEYKSDWSPDFFARFEQHRGYKLQTELPSLFGNNEDERAARVRSDYRETVSDIMVEESLPKWVKWSHAHGFLTRNEAHGSPGNLLDLYGLSDVPETEMFNKDRNKLVSKFASSAAHTTGKKFIGAETGTWLNEHFTESLADMKYLLDDMFLSGVNHVYYHGTCYSPDEAGWPGWVFYASYEMNPRNAVWHDVASLNAYASRCQAVLQAGQPDNDILLYWPIHDFWHSAKDTLLPHFTVHARAWFEDQSIGRTASELWNRGYSFDYVSDRQLQSAKVNNGEISLGEANYRVVLVPPCEHLPVESLRQLLTMAKSGATVIFEGDVPQDVPGWAELAKRRQEFKSLIKNIKPQPRQAYGKGYILIGDRETALSAAGVTRETMFDLQGLMCIRRKQANSGYYFIANRGENNFEGWLPLASAAKSIVIMDAMSGQTGLAATRQRAGGGTEVFVQLPAGSSIILEIIKEGKIDGMTWAYWRESTMNDAKKITGAWKVQFFSGGPNVPADYTTTNPASWTEAPDTNALAFAGTARYTTIFDCPQRKDGGSHWALDLGRVAQSARVKLNGKVLGTRFISPFRFVANNLQPTGNILEVEVTSTSANRIRDLDRRGVVWQNFYDINFVNINYKKFNAADWPIAEAGLIGPVTLTAIEEFNLISQ